MNDLDALRKRLRPKWSHSRKTERECYMDGVDAAVAALEQVGWQRGDSVVAPGEANFRWPPSRADHPVYRIKPQEASDA